MQKSREAGIRLGSGYVCRALFRICGEDMGQYPIHFQPKEVWYVVFERDRSQVPGILAG